MNIFDIKNPDFVKSLSISELEKLASDIRNFLMKSVSKTGGHIGAALGTIELTISLHYAFPMFENKIIFDTGHQGYTHKILTGRINLFASLNKEGGMSRFLDRAESDYDLIDASHAGTSISISSGMAFVNKINNNNNKVVAVVGDGATVEGMSFEGLNYSSNAKLPIVIVINDNGMAIPKNVGGINHMGWSSNNWGKKSRMFFEALGFKSFTVEDGHNLSDLVDTFQKVNKINQRSVVVHVRTEKGKGLKMASSHPYKMHFSMPFDPNTGAGVSPVPPGVTYSTISGQVLEQLLEKNKKLVALTPSTPYASGIDTLLDKFPNQIIDVGMAEQHAIGMAVGIALAGFTPFVFFQSTFMQRAYDQLIHDVCYMKLNVTIFASRSGFSGLDSATHHAIYDLSYLRSIPNLKIFYPANSNDLTRIMHKCSDNEEGPMLVLYPYEQVFDKESEYVDIDSDIQKPQLIFNGLDGHIICLGNTLEKALIVREELKIDGIDIGIINLRWVKPLPENWLLSHITKNSKVVTLEENCLSGGLGEMFASFVSRHNLNCNLIINSIDDVFIPPGNKSALEKFSKIDSKSILKQLRKSWL